MNQYNSNRANLPDWEIHGIQPKFSYDMLGRTETTEGRFYIVHKEKLPSVTTILSKTTDMSYINDWKDAVGHDKAKQIVDESTLLGSYMHQNIENYILGAPMSGSFMAKTLANLIIKQGLYKITTIWGTEVPLYYPGLYAGTADLIGDINGEPCIVDFKNSRTLKKLDHIENYRAQIGAYALAHNELYGTDIKSGIIMVGTRDATYQEFVFRGSEFTKCIDLWCSKLENYYTMVENTDSTTSINNNTGTK